MPSMKWTGTLLVVLGAAIVPFLSCKSTTDPLDVGPGPELTILRFAPSALPLATRNVSFWAVRGQTREVEIHYVPDRPGDEGEEFLEFKVGGNSLLRAPNGRFYARGDSVRITIRVDDAGRFLFDFQPSGLVFDPDHPAELEVSYRRADPDRNGDGRVDELDRQLDERMSLWKQEGPGRPWSKVGTVRVEDLEEVRARITGFTGFAVAS